MTTVLVAATLGAASLAQTWSTAYEAGLKATKAGRWTDARTAFQQAIAYRPEDQATPTILPGPPTEQRQWRRGAPYSPNFLAAYAAYRLAIASTGPEATQYFATAAAEFETLIAKNQVSRETLFFLAAIYSTRGETAKRDALASKVPTATWKVDTEPLSEDERRLFGLAITIPEGGATQPTREITLASAAPPAAVGDKYALVIGNSESRIRGAALPFASDDAQAVRQALQTSAGYQAANIDLVLNATAPQILASAKAMAERLPANATVTIYFTGAGTNINGRDYLAGIETENLNDAASMVAKSELYELFTKRGAAVFAFFQVNRATVNGRFFGQEIPAVGPISQAQATLPGETVRSVVRNGATVGLYTSAFVQVMQEFRTNRIPIYEFGWQVFDRIRRGGTGTVGGSSQQTPTLPVLVNMANDARF